MAFNPKTLDAILQQAAALYEAGQSGQARQLASDVLKKDPRNIGGLRIFAHELTRNSRRALSAIFRVRGASGLTSWGWSQPEKLVPRTICSVPT